MDDHLLCRATHHPAQPGGVHERHRDDEHRVGGPQATDDHQHDEQRWQSEHDIEELGDHDVDPAAPVGGKEAQAAADEQRERHGDERDEQDGGPAV